MRKSGILMPVASLPGRYGIGTMGKEAYNFIDRLKEAGQSYWQILPIGPTGYGDSPYQSVSTFAGNPYFIDLDILVEKGLLTSKECDACDFGSEQNKIDYEKIYFARFDLLRKAFERFKKNKGEKDSKFVSFCKENDYWLADYALYMAVKDSFGGKSFIEWDDDIRLRDEKALREYSQKYSDEIAYYKFLQFEFRNQWFDLKKYANDNGVKIIGDIPFYVAFDSADTWANPKLFQFTEAGYPVAVAGCPPDGFSADGQLWGNPLYDWRYHKDTEYAWWISRTGYCHKLYDIIRVDHFRAFDAYYAIPYGDKNAKNGKWKKGPGMEIFKAMRAKLGEIEIIAEDLGFLTDSVIKLVQRTGFPGMKVLQFAFDSREDSDYLPHNYSSNCVVYTGTHDNDTTVGWYKSMKKSDRQMAMNYLNATEFSTDMEIAMAFVKLAMSSVAQLCIIPMQDYLGLDHEARINTPSTLGNNWNWRMDKKAFTGKVAKNIRSITELYARI